MLKRAFVGFNPFSEEYHTNDDVIRSETNWDCYADNHGMMIKTVVIVLFSILNVFFGNAMTTGKDIRQDDKFGCFVRSTQEIVC